MKMLLKFGYIFKSMKLRIYFFKQAIIFDMNLFYM